MFNFNKFDNYYNVIIIFIITNFTQIIKDDFIPIIKNDFIPIIKNNFIPIIKYYFMKNNIMIIYLFIVLIIIYIIFIKLFYFNLDKTTSITIPIHRKKIINSNDKSDDKGEYIDIYSLYFRSINYYLLNNNFIIIDNLIEKKCIENLTVNDSIMDFILLPNIDFNNNLLICKKRNIYFTIKKNKIIENNKNIYIDTYVLSIPSLNKINLLKEFLNECVDIYNLRNNRGKKQTIFEYIRSYNYYDGDKLKSQLLFSETIFYSNKILDKNIFYDGIDELVTYIERFTNNSEKYINEYKLLGRPYKATILLYGIPGSGKSSTIKGILNKTGRHGLIIQWSKIRTNSELLSLFRNPIINDQKYDLSELCYIFEDFDANFNNNILKKRNEFKNISKNEEKLKKHNDEISKEKNEIDMLTLECVLNILDGIIELHNSMIIFTTNISLDDIDSAFIRPGRIDFKLELKKCNINTIYKILQLKFGNFDTNNYNIDKLDKKLLPSDIQDICFNSNNIDECINKLLKLVI